MKKWGWFRDIFRTRNYLKVLCSKLRRFLLSGTMEQYGTERYNERYGTAQNKRNGKRNGTVLAQNKRNGPKMTGI